MTAEAADSKRRWTPTALAALVPPIVRPAFRKRSPAASRILADWPMLVGPGVSARVEPRSYARGTLTVVCDGPTAMELQLSERVLAERINVALGENCVERIRVVQGRVLGPAPVRRRVAVEVAPVDGLGEELGLRLARLGAAIRARDAGEG